MRAEAGRSARGLLAAGIALSTALWVFLVVAHGSPGLAGHGAPGLAGHGAPGLASGSQAAAGPAALAFLAAALLWCTMMAAMMIPAALPWLAALAATCDDARSRYARASGFLAGYLTVWSAFGMAAAAAQVLLVQHALIEPHGLRLGGHLAAGVLLAAGAYELTPLKAACLRHCRSPFGIWLEGWGRAGSSPFAIGLRHGMTCLACCWALMALAFVVGVVSLPWMALLTALVCAEKLLPRGEALPRLVGTALLAWGGGLLLSAVI